jgi:RNA-binding protein YhbY
MDIIVIGMENEHIIEKLKKRHDVKVILVPGDTLIIYQFNRNTGFREIDGDAAILYLKSLSNER